VRKLDTFYSRNYKNIDASKIGVTLQITHAVLEHKGHFARKKTSFAPENKRMDQASMKI